MTQVFGAEYAAAYDELYGDKDYAAECDLLEDIFRRYAQTPVRRMLDLGCGTGNHAVPLSLRGYDVVGVDRSEDMLRSAAARGTTARFVHSDILSLQLETNFDAVIMMFAVLGYQTRNCDVRGALETVRRHLRPGGLFFADVWYGPAVLAQRPSERVKVVDSPEGGQIIRVATSELDTLRDVCTVRYRLWRTTTGGAEVYEAHPMRYFFAPELELLLNDAGFELARLGAFPDFDQEPSEQTWNVAFAARAV